MRRGRRAAERLTAGLLALLAGFALAIQAPAPEARALPGTAIRTALPAPVTAAANIDVSIGSYGLLRPGDDLQLTVTITNTSGQPLVPGVAELFLASSPSGPGSPSSFSPTSAPDATSAATPTATTTTTTTDHRGLSEWFDQSTGAETLGSPLDQATVPALLPGEAATLPVITVPSATLTASGGDSAPGVRKLAVRLLSGSVPVAEFHTSVTTLPAPLVLARLAIAMPLVLPPTSTATVSAELLAQYTSPTGILTRQLDQAYAAPVAIAIDPRILSSIRVLGSAIPDSAAQWLARLQSAPNTTFALSFGDSDISATSQAGVGLLAPTRFVIDPAHFPASTTPVRPTASPSASPDITAPNPALPSMASLLAFPYTLSALAWPREESVVDADLDAFAAAGLTTTILSTSNSSLAAAHSIAGATASINGRAILNSDDEVSARLREAVGASTETEWQSAMARLNSTLAVLAADNPVATRVTLASLSRIPSASPFRLAETLSAIATMTWTTPTSLATAFAEKPVTATLTAKPVAASRIAAIKQMVASEGAVAKFSSILSDPTALTAERRLALLSLSSQSWLSTSLDWSAAVADYVHRSTTLLDSVKVVNSSTINLLSNKGLLPITVNNALPYPVTVYVDVRSQTAVLNIQNPRVKLTVEANSQNRAFVPVQSIANGEVTIVVGLVSATGLVVGPQALATINVQAGWETAATAILAALLIGVFVLGIIRTVRRRRRAVPRPTN